MESTFTLDLKISELSKVFDFLCSKPGKKRDNYLMEEMNKIQETIKEKWVMRGLFYPSLYI